MTDRSPATRHHAPSPARRLVSSCFVVTLFSWCAASVAAHDFWIEPTAYSVDAGRIVGIRARVGDGFLGDPVPRDPSLLDQLVVESSEGRHPVAGRDGGDPAGLLRAATPGLHVVGYLGKPSRVELSADKFNTYLKEEGLDAVLATRMRLGQTASGARELFTRCAKTLVQVGGVRPGDRDRALGCRLELVAENSPYALGPGQALSVRLTYEGRPLEGALVVAMHKKRGSERIAARTDREGRVRLTLPGSGVWLVKAVHMVPAPSNAAADWASDWASLTFELPPRSIEPASPEGRS